MEQQVLQKSKIVQLVEAPNVGNGTSHNIHVAISGPMIAILKFQASYTLPTRPTRWKF